MTDEGTQLELFEGAGTPAPLVPGLVLVPDLLRPAEQRRLLDAVDREEWSTELKRRVQHHGWRYDYRARRVNSGMFLGPLPGWSAGLVARLLRRGLLPEAPDQLIVNEYLPGQGISQHVDCEPCFKEHVASVSLGSAVDLEMVERVTGRTEFLRLAPGSVFVLAGPARRDWTHGIRARLRDGSAPRGRRVSLTFRKVIPPRREGERL